MVTDTDCVHTPPCRCICDSDCCLHTPLEFCLKDLREPRLLHNAQRDFLIKRKYLNGVSYEQIADDFGIDVRTVKRVLQRVRTYVYTN